MSFNKAEWRPSKKQEQFLSLPTTIKEAFYGGGAGSGKTDILLIYGIINRWHENPNFKQVFMRRTYPEIRNEVLPRSRELYSKFGATLNRSEMAWTFPSGAMIFFAHCEDESDVHKWDSAEINLYTPDELTSFVEYIYLYIGFTRVRTSDRTLPAIIRAAGMAGGIGHNFVKKRFVDPYPAGGKIIKGRGGNKRVYIHSTLADNPHIDPLYSQSLEVLPEAEKRAKKYGDWNAYLGQVFDEFRDYKYPDEPDNALHVIEPIDIPEWWPRFVIGDWGFAAMTYVGFFAVSPDKRLYLYRELYWLKTKISEWAPIVKEFCDKENPRIVKFCKSAGQDRGQENTIQKQISDELGVPIQLSTNSPGSRVAGKMLIHEYLRWKLRPIVSREIAVYNEEYALWLLRNRTEKEYKSYLNSFVPSEPETNIPKLQIFNTCKVMIDAIKACSYDKPKNNKPAEDIAEFEGDDPIDDLRYAVDTADRYFDEAKDEFDKITKQQELVQLLQNNQDWTAFYRNMARIESQDKVEMVSRFHHSRGH